MGGETVTGFTKFLHEARAIFLIYLCFVLLVYVFQSYIIYQPFGTFGSPEDAGLNQMEEVYIKTHDGLDLKAWFAPPTTKNKVVVFFHGNGGNAGGRDIKAKEFLDAGYGFLLTEYRGYGGNPGYPKESCIKKDAQTTLDFLKNKGYSGNDIILYGESIGTAVAVYTATNNAPYAVILEAPFSSLLDVAKDAYWFFPVKLMLREKYDTIGIIKKIKSPILIVHGENDKIVPIKFSKQLFKAAPPLKKAVFIPEAGHNNLHHYGALKSMIQWLDSSPDNTSQ